MVLAFCSDEIERGDNLNFMTDRIASEDTSSVGQLLKTTRLEQSLTLEQISKALYLSKRQLSYLEEDAEHLVCDVYTLGFVKLYAQYLKLNEQDIVERFKEQTIHHHQSSPLIFPAPLPGRGMPSFHVLALSLFVLAVIIIGWKWKGNDASLPSFHPDVLVHQDDSVVTVNVGNEEAAAINIEDPAPSPQQHTTLSESALQEKITPIEKIYSSPESPSQPVNLHITEEAWIEVKDKEGNIIVSRIFRPGESFEFKNSEDFVLKTGNLKGTHLSSGTRIYPNEGNSGEVGRNIPLDPEKWLEQGPESD